MLLFILVVVYCASESIIKEIKNLRLKSVTKPETVVANCSNFRYSE